MKKIILCFALLLGAATAYAQPGVKFGITAGMNASKVKFKDFKGTFDPSNRYGFYVGPKLNINLALGFGLDVAAVYNQKRMNLEEDYSRMLRSVEIPINVRYTVGLGKLLGIYGFTGPQFGWNIGNTKWSTVTQDFTRENANVSWNVGAGLKVMNRVEVGVGYNIALSKYANIIEKTNTDVEGKNYNFKTNTVQLQVAYLF